MYHPLWSHLQAIPFVLCLSSMSMLPSPSCLCCPCHFAFDNSPAKIETPGPHFFVEKNKNRTETIRKIFLIDLNLPFIRKLVLGLVCYPTQYTCAEKWQLFSLNGISQRNEGSWEIGNENILLDWNFLPKPLVLYTRALTIWATQPLVGSLPKRLG